MSGVVSWLGRYWTKLSALELTEVAEVGEDGDEAVLDVDVRGVFFSPYAHA